MKAEQARQLAVECRPKYEERLKSEAIGEIEKAARESRYATVVDVRVSDEQFLTDYLKGLGYAVSQVGSNDMVIHLQVNW